MADSVRFGLQTYSPAGNGDQGGRVHNPVGDAFEDIVATINGQYMLNDTPNNDMFTPMGENLFTAAGYMGQVDVTDVNGPRYDALGYTVSNSWDPYWDSDNNIYVPCRKSFVIMISDGEANNDTNIPAENRPAVAGEVTGTNNYLDNVAYWAHTNDIRSAVFGLDLEDKQTLTLYTISTFGGGETLLKSAAKFGGFEDRNENNLPDLPIEWDQDGDGLPDNYFSASTATDLREGLLASLTDLLHRSAVWCHSKSLMSVLLENRII